MNIEYRMTALKIYIQLYAFFCKMQRICLFFIKIKFKLPLRDFILQRLTNLGCLILNFHR